MRSRRNLAISASLLMAASTAACSTGADHDPSATEGSLSPSLGTVTVVTHDSFAIPSDLVESFESRTGYTLEFVAPGDGGALVNQLILTKDAPLGDVVFGIDNTFASRAIDAGVVVEYHSSADAAGDADRYAVPGSTALTAVDFSDVCVNIDLASFGPDTPPPSSLEDLTDPAYAGQFSLPSPATSSTGLAFLLATIAAKGDDWQDYWRRLDDNDARVTASWSDSYFVDFAAPNYGGDYPIVLSYASSPPSEVVDGAPTTAALLDTCFRQVEYAGVLTGARNPEGARAVVDWMLSDEFQSAVPESMYVYPVSTSVAVPKEWAAYAPLAERPFSIDPAEIASNRDAWIDQWADIMVR